LPKEGDREFKNSQIVLKPENILHLNADLPIRNPLEELFDDAYEHDAFPRSVLQMLTDNVRYSKLISLGECAEVNGRLTYRSRLYVPDHEPLRLHLLQQHHEPPAAGHPGRSKTLE